MLCGEQTCFTYCTLLNTMVYTHRQVAISSKNIKLTTYKGKQLKWRFHNDATIPKVELWFQLRHCCEDFEVVYTFELMTQPSENCSGAENR